MAHKPAAPTDTTDRTLRLLWRGSLGEPEGSRGPKQRLSVDDVVSAAVAIADEQGIAALSMRRLGERVGVSSMSLYTYVPGRDELVGLMIDHVAGEATLPAHGKDLRGRLEGVARVQWEELRRHPWLLDVEAHRPWIGPNSCERYEWQLAAVEGFGLDDIEMDQTITFVLGVANRAARGATLAARERESSGISDADWWAQHVPLLERVMERDRYPLSQRVGTATGAAYEAPSDPVRALEFGLARALDAIELYVQRRATETRAKP